MSLRRSTRLGTQLASPKSTVRSKYFQKDPKPHILVKKEDNDISTDTITPILDNDPAPEIKIEIKEEEPEVKIPKSVKRRKVETVKVELEQAKIPKNFYDIYNHIKTMRSKIITPVDTMGCANIPKTISGESELTQKNYRFQLLVSLMISSQTKDEVNFKAMQKMRSYFQSEGFEEGISIASMLWVDEKKLDELIYSVGFHTRKASYLKKAAEILRDEFDGEIPNTLEGLIRLPGVGPKMAFLTLQEGWGLNLGIGVDTHVHRLSKMWGWVNKNAKDPEVTRLELERWLPKEYWREINPLLVGFGQTICLPRGRRCDLCSLSTTRLCPNVDRALLKKVGKLSQEELDSMNKTIRGDITGLRDIEDLA